MSQLTEKDVASQLIKCNDKISTQSRTTLCIQFLDRENNNKNNTLPLVKQICFTIVWGCVEILPEAAIEDERHPKFGQPTLGNEVFERNQ